MVDALATVSPELAVRLRAADAAAQRRAARAAVLWAVERTGLTAPEVDEGLRVLEAPETDPQVRARVQELADRVDERYFDLKEQAEAGADTVGEYRSLFDQARAATALADALGGDPARAALDAVYEASATVDDPQPLFVVVNDAL